MCGFITPQCQWFDTHELEFDAGKKVKVGDAEHGGVYTLHRRREICSQFAAFGFDFRCTFVIHSGCFSFNGMNEEYCQ